MMARVMKAGLRCSALAVNHRLRDQGINQSIWLMPLWARAAAGLRRQAWAGEATTGGRGGEREFSFFCAVLTLGIVSFSPLSEGGAKENDPLFPRPFSYPYLCRLCSFLASTLVLIREPKLTLSSPQWGLNA